MKRHHIVGMLFTELIPILGRKLINKRVKIFLQFGKISRTVELLYKCIYPITEFSKIPLQTVNCSDGKDSPHMEEFLSLQYLQFCMLISASF